MKDIQLYHFLSLLAPAILAKIILSRALQSLDTRKRVALLTAVEGINKIRIPTLFLLVILLFFLPRASLVLLPLFLSGMSWIYWKRIAPLDLPNEYIQAFRFSVVLGAIAMGLFLFLPGRS